MSEEILFPFCFVRQTPNGIIINANVFCDGFVKAYWHKIGFNNAIHCIKLTEEQTELADFREGRGTYEFWLEDLLGNTTASQFQYISLEPPRASLQRINQYISNPVSQNFINGELAAIKPNELATSPEYAVLMLERLKKIKETMQHEKRGYSQFIATAEKEANLNAVRMNKQAAGKIVFNYQEETLDLSESIADFVEIYKLCGKLEELVSQIPVTASEVCHLSFMPQNAYHIKIFKGSSLLCQLVHCELSEEERAYFWEEAIKLDNDIDEIILSDQVLNHAGIPLTPDEISAIKAERRGEPIDLIVRRPKATIYDNTCIIELEDYELLRALGKKRYISFRESDLIGDTTFDSVVEANSDMTALFLKENALETEALFLVEDEDRTRLSRMSRVSIEGDNSEYRDKQRRLELAEYFHVLSQNLKTSSYLKRFLPIVSDTYEALTADEDTDVDNVIWRLLCRLAMDTNRLIQGRNDLFYFLLSDWIQRFNFDINFFSEPIWEEINTGRLSWPVERNHYALVEASFNFGDVEPEFKYFSSSKNESTDVYLNEKDFYVLYAIDAKTLRRSGFVYACTAPNNHCRLTNLLPNELKLLEIKDGR